MDDQASDNSSKKESSFSELGVCESLCGTIKALGWSKPSPIQEECLKYVFEEKDVIGLAETGSGKTGAFAIPIIQRLINRPQRMYALVLSPTRELAFQIAQQFEALGSEIGLKTAVVVGGVDMVQQALALSRKPHVVIGTPGRLVDHMQNTKGFSVQSFKFLVLDEADRMLSMDFEEEIHKIVESMPKDRRTYLFSATMTQKVAKLQRASLHDPVRVEVSSKYQTVHSLVQQYCFIPAKYKDCYLAFVLNEFSGKTSIVFVATCSTAQRLAYMLRDLGFKAVCLHGNMAQTKRLVALSGFKNGEKNVLIATDVASRGLDIPNVDLVLNYDIPNNGKDYIHRVGRTARAGRSGRAISFVTQYDVENYQRIEKLIDKKLDSYPCEENMVMVLLERVTEAQKLAVRHMKESLEKKGKDKWKEDDEDNDTIAIPKEAMRKKATDKYAKKPQSKFRRRN